MRKLYKLKNWYSLEDAAKRLTITLGEEVSVSDVLQMTIEGHLPLSWNMRHISAQEVAPVTRFRNHDEDPKRMLEVFLLPPDFKKGKLTASFCLERQTHRVEHLTGVFRLDLEMCGAMKDWVLSLITNTGGELICLDGYFVFGDDGTMWQILDQHEKRNDKQLGIEPKPVNHPDNFYPSGGSPDTADLGVTKSDLETFEGLLADAPYKDSLKPKERHSLLKLVLGMAIDAYGYNVQASRSPTAKSIADDLLTRGISIDEDTVRKWLNEAKDCIDIQTESVDS